MTIPQARDTSGARDRGARDRWAQGAVVLLTLAAALWRFPWLTAEDLWFDEVFSVVLASQDLGELLRRAIGDQTNPPGFYLLLSGWIRLGSVDEGWIRALPALAGTLTVPALVALARTLRLDWGTALLAGLLAAVAPLLLAMSVEVRAYAPVALLVTISLTLAVRVAADPQAPSAARDRALLAATDVALVMLHYFGALVVAARVLSAFVVARRPASAANAVDAPRIRRDAIVAAIPAAMALATWLAIVIAQASDRVGTNASWIPAADVSTALSFASQVVGTFGTRAGAIAVGAVVLLALILPFGRRATTARAAAPWLLSAALVPVVIVLGASLLTGRSLWVARYLIVVLPALLLLVAGIPAALPVRWRTAASTLLAGWAIAAGTLSIGLRQQKPAWSRIVPALTAGGATTVCVNEPFVGLPLQYHALRSGAPLSVFEIATCASARTGDWVVLRPGTEGSLEALRAARGTPGAARLLGTELPPLLAIRLEWPDRAPREAR